MSTLDTLGLTSGKTIEVTDARGDTRETQAAQLSYTYVFDGKAQYDRFVKNVRTADPDTHTPSRPLTSNHTKRASCRWTT